MVPVSPAVNAADPATILASDQADPCRGIYPAWLWQPGETIAAKAVLAVPPDLPAGDYALRVEMFRLLRRTRCRPPLATKRC